MTMIHQSLTSKNGSHRKNSLFIAIFCFTIPVLLVAIFLLIGTNQIDGTGVILIILSIGVGIVALVPAIISLKTHNQVFDLFHPLFYAAWFFFIPHFSIAGSFTAFNIINSSFDILVTNPRYAQSQTLWFVILGSAGLSTGYFMRIGKWFGNKLPNFRAFDASPNVLKLAASIFLIIGFVAQIGSFQEGLAGYQFNAIISTTEAIFAFFATLTTVGQGIIWFSFFKNRRQWMFLALLALGAILFNAYISGSRGSLFHSILPVMAGYQYAQEHNRFRKMWKWFLVLLFIILVGMNFGTLFRINVQSTYGRTKSLDISNVNTLSSETIQSIQQQELRDNIIFGWERLLERLNALPSLTVIIVNAERLKGMEMAAGIHNNIMRDLLTSLIPRFIWPTKPISNGAEIIGRLYFNTKFNSPAVTYIGDLYRNFGPFSIMPGMMFLGIILRTIYSWLIEQRRITPFRVGLFMLLGFTVNYEGLYSGFIPSLIRTSFIACIALLIISILSRLASSRTTRTY